MAAHVPVSMEVTTDNRGRATLGSVFADRELRIAVEDEISISELTVYFARSDMNLSENGTTDLMADNRFGIDWEVGPMTHESVYEPHGQGAVKDINAMKRIERSGALVCAAYKSVTETIVRIGIVPPYSVIESCPYESIDREPRHVKTHQMYHVTEVSDEEAPELFERRPRGSIRRWRKKSNEIRERYRSSRS